MLKQVNGRWALVSRKTQKPLAYFKGEGKPSDEWVRKQENRIQFFKHGFSEQLAEASYAGNIGVMELVKFYDKAADNDKATMKKLIAQKNNREAWKLVQRVTGVKLHKSINEEKKSPNPDILPKSGAGQDGTDTLVKSYQRDTPGQSKIIGFKKYNKM
jgi:hypothetical protein